jgi:hypothetical protein
LSKALGPRTSGLSAYEKEYWAILLVVDHWGSYLQHSEFLICTDQHSLIHREEQRLSTAWQKKAFSKLPRLYYQIIYQQGKSNSMADALSRKRQPKVLAVATLSVCQPMWLQQVVDWYSSDPVALKLKAALALSSGDVNS